MNSSSPHQERITACALLLPWQHTLIVLLILGFLEECTNFHVVSKACRILTPLKLTLEARRIFRGCIHKTIVSLLPTRPRKIARYSKKPEINSIGISSYSECIIITNLSSGPHRVRCFSARHSWRWWPRTLSSFMRGSLRVSVSSVCWGSWGTSDKYGGRSLGRISSLNRGQ